MRITPDRFSAVMPLLTEKTAHLPLLKSVLQGDLGGRVFVDDPNVIRSALIISRLNWVYFVGSEDCGRFEREMIANLKEEHGGNYFWFGISDRWRALVRGNLSHEVRDFPRLQFRFCPEAFKGKVAASPEALPIDEAALEKILSKYHPDGGFWDSRADFLRKGIGFYVGDGEEIVSVVTSASVTETEAEIDIHTDECHRGKGYAELLCRAFIDACLNRGLLPKWDCYWQNAPSIVLAEKLGFALVGKYPLASFRLQRPAGS